MKLFRCTCAAAPLLYFENVACGRCGRLVGFVPEARALKPFVRAGTGNDDLWLDDDGHAYRLCGNRVRHGACNWMVEARGGAGPRLCTGCRSNRVIPDLSVPGNLALWQALERAKRRCLFTFLELGLPFDGQTGGQASGQASGQAGGEAGGGGVRGGARPGVPALGFRFMADGARNPPGSAHAGSDDGRVMTGHEDGIVTINLAEADEISRIRTQLAMQERYRTLLGHFRHETGHYFWDRFARADEGFVATFRERFGDERADYAAAVAAHYAAGPPANWSGTHISAYATMHPWEDWAETWAHYLHIIDTLETQQSFGVETRLVTAGVREARLPFAVGVGADAERCDFDAIVALWIEVSVMLNSLNRSMGLPDPYPFVLSAAAIEKLRFVHEAVLASPGHGG